MNIFILWLKLTMKSLLLIFLYIYYCFCVGNISFKYSCIPDPPNPGCINVTNIAFDGNFDFARNNITGFITDDEQDIFITIEVLQVWAGFNLPRAGVFRNGYVKAQMVEICCNDAFCPSCGWCNTNCEEVASCDGCIGTDQPTPYQAPEGEGGNGISFCDLCDGIDINPKGPKISCECTSATFSSETCCQYNVFFVPIKTSGFIKNASCMFIIDGVTPKGQSNSRLDYRLPEGFEGLGIIYVKVGNLFDFYAILSDNLRQSFTTSLGMAYVQVQQVNQGSPFISGQGIGIDLAKQSVSKINTYLLNNDQFISFNTDATKWGPIEEDPNHPGEFLSLIFPSNMVNFGEPDGCSRRYASDVINQDIKDLLNSNTDMHGGSEHSQYKDEETCKNQEFNCPDVLSKQKCIDAFKSECMSGNDVGNGEKQLIFTVAIQGVRPIGINPLGCVFTSTLVSCETDGQSGFGACTFDQTCTGTAPVQYYTPIGSGGVEKKSVECEDIDNIPINLNGIVTTNFVWCACCGSECENNFTKECHNGTTSFSTAPEKGEKRSGEGGNGKEGLPPAVSIFIVIGIIAGVILIVYLFTRSSTGVTIVTGGASTFRPTPQRNSK